MVAGAVEAQAPKSRKTQRRSDFELAAHHQRQALLLRNKGQKNMIDQSLKQFPEDIPEVFEFLVQKGRLTRSSGENPPTPRIAGTGGTGTDAETPVKQERDEEKDIAGEENGEHAGAKVEDPADDDEAAVFKVLGPRIADTYNRFGGRHGLPAKAWKAILTCLEPVAFSSNNQAALVVGSRRCIDTDLACECCDFMTGCDDSTSIVGDLRCTGSLLRYLKDKNMENGRVAQLLRLPPNWATDGWWQVVERTIERIILSHLNSDETVEVEPHHMEMEAGDDFLEVTVFRNFSLRRAVLQDASGTKILNLYGHFLKRLKEEGAAAESAGERTPQVKKPRMASPLRPTAAARSEAEEKPPPPPELAARRRLNVKTK